MVQDSVKTAQEAAGGSESFDMHANLASKMELKAAKSRHYVLAKLSVVGCRPPSSPLAVHLISA